jgi:hypothetical protein
LLISTNQSNEGDKCVAGKGAGAPHECMYRSKHNIIILRYTSRVRVLSVRIYVVNI